MRRQEPRSIPVRNQRSIRRELIRSSMGHITRNDGKFETWEHTDVHGTATKALNAVMQFLLDQGDHSIRAEVGKIVGCQLWGERDLPENQATAWAIDDVGADERRGGRPEGLFLGNRTEEEANIHATGYIGAEY